jgi:hypothetical protein
MHHFLHCLVCGELMASYSIFLGGEREREGGGEEGRPKEGGLGCMDDALKPQTSVAEELQLNVGEDGYATTTPANSNLQLLL